MARHKGFQKVTAHLSESPGWCLSVLPRKGCLDVSARAGLGVCLLLGVPMDILEAVM